MTRIHSSLGESIPKTKMAYAWLYTCRGIPQLYYGTEVLLQNTENPGNHGYIRTDMPGGWTGDVANAFTGKGLSNDQLSMQRYTQGLLQWRKNNKIITHYYSLPSKEIMDLFKQLNKEGQTIIMVTHNDENRPYFDRTVVLRDGEIDSDSARTPKAVSQAG